MLNFLSLFLILLSASVVRYTYLHLLARGVAAAVDAGDGNRIDASVSGACSLGSKLHVICIQDNPVWRCITVSCTIDRLITGHAQSAGVRWQGAVVCNIIVDCYIHQPMVWRP